jgi:hypothetical protein
MIGRRGFIGALAAATVGMVLDPERALWVPGRTSYFDLVRHRPINMSVSWDWDRTIPVFDPADIRRASLRLANEIDRRALQQFRIESNDGWAVQSAGPLQPGDIITIEGIYQV